MLRILTAKPMLGRSLFLLQNRFFCPRTAKAQPMWFFQHVFECNFSIFVMVTWPSRNCIQKHVEKITDSLNAILFDLSYRGTTVSEQWRHQALVAFLARHSSRTKHRSKILSYSFDLQSCLHKCKRLAWRKCCNALEKFAVKFAKKLNGGPWLIYITPLKTAKMPPLWTLGHIDTRRQYILLVLLLHR